MRNFVIYREYYEIRGWRNEWDMLHASEIIKMCTWLWGYLKERDRLEDVGLGLKELGWKDVNAIQLARGRDQWQVLVNVLTDLHVHKMLIY